MEKNWWIGEWGKEKRSLVISHWEKEKNVISDWWIGEW
jgi:hypothetical protein